MPKNVGIKIRIAHAHNSSYEKSLKGFVLHILSRFSKKYSNLNLACSEMAGKYLFGDSKFEVIYNGIDVEKFKFNSTTRTRIREKMQLNEKFVIGHIGRFELQKNHIGLIRIFDEICKNDKNTLLLLIGEGKLRSQIEKEVKNRNIENNVIFLGIRDNVNEIMQAMDCFLLPSLYEGLPVVGVEAQIAGLPSIFSNTITQEVKVNNKSFFMDNSNLEEWKNKVFEFMSDRKRAANNSDNIEKFDIKRTSKTLERKYLEMIKGE